HYARPWRQSNLPIAAVQVVDLPPSSTNRQDEGDHRHDQCRYGHPERDGHLDHEGPEPTCQVFYRRSDSCNHLRLSPNLCLELLMSRAEVIGGATGRSRLWLLPEYLRDFIDRLFQHLPDRVGAEDCE